jgi:EAL domain-containing protein (putative c-di-GMP-specific phosphodiesterase class I)
MKMCINLSGRQLTDDRLVDDVAQVLARTGVDPTSIVLEITESVLMEDTDLTIDRLQALKQLGVSLAIDDFGTGYSSLAYLRRFPIDILKIDRSFVSAASRGAPGGLALVRTMVELASSLHLETIAEGIETEAEASHLFATGCSTGQGFLFSPAVRAEEVAGFLLAADTNSDLAELSG